MPILTKATASGRQQLANTGAIAKQPLNQYKPIPGASGGTGAAAAAAAAGGQRSPGQTPTGGAAPYGKGTVQPAPAIPPPGQPRPTVPAMPGKIQPTNPPPAIAAANPGQTANRPFAMSETIYRNAMAAKTPQMAPAGANPAQLPQTQQPGGLVDLSKPTTTKGPMGSTQGPAGPQIEYGNRSPGQTAPGGMGGVVGYNGSVVGGAGGGGSGGNLGLERVDHAPSKTPDGYTKMQGQTQSIVAPGTSTHIPGTQNYSTIGDMVKDFSPTGDVDGDGHQNLGDADPRYNNDQIENAGGPADPNNTHAARDPAGAASDMLTKLVEQAGGPLGDVADKMTDADTASAKKYYDDYLQQLDAMKNHANEQWGSDARAKAEEAARGQLRDDVHSDQDRQMRAMLGRASRGGVQSSGAATGIYNAAQGALSSGLRGLAQDKFGRDAKASEMWTDARNNVAEKTKEFTDENTMSRQKLLAMLMEGIPDDFSVMDFSLPG